MSGVSLTPVLSSPADAESIEDEINGLSSLPLTELRKKYEQVDEKYKEQMYVEATLVRLRKHSLIAEIHDILSKKAHEADYEVQVANLPKYLSLYNKSIRYKHNSDEMGDLLDAIQNAITNCESSGSGAGATTAVPTPKRKVGRPTKEEAAAREAAGIQSKKRRKSEALGPRSDEEQEGEDA